MSHQIVISASRRTDIPAFYMPWFMTSIDQGHFDVVNPYNRQISRVAANPDHVHTIVFWSKDFGPLLSNQYDKLLTQRGYRLFFNFTINSPHPQLEPAVPPLQQRLDQLSRLCDGYGPDCIQWRFDPICYFHFHNAPLSNNLDQFEFIARHAAEQGISRCITSFVDLYRKVQRRLDSPNAPMLVDPPMATKTAQMTAMADLLAALNIRLQMCCEKEVLAALPSRTAVEPASCIPTHLLIRLYGPGISHSKDHGQRRTAGCQCGLSKDIGSYHLHPCHHNCLFCYANPSS